MFRGFWRQPEKSPSLTGVEELDSSQKRDLNRIKQLFYREFDFRKAHDLLIKGGQTTKSITRLLGEGTHFKSYVFNRENPLPLVISIAKVNFRGNLPSRFARWQACLRQIKRLGLPLVPPFEIVSQGSHIGYITPYIPDPPDTCADHWLPLETQCDLLFRRIGDLGLVIDDYWQIKCLDGVPFIVDLSDLKFRSSD